jgi:choline dehydrogenase-like flavoprotein
VAGEEQSGGADGCAVCRAVLQVQGLRVADASVTPDMIEAGPMATIYMIGEKAADMIKEDNRKWGQGKQKA